MFVAVLSFFVFGVKGNLIFNVKCDSTMSSSLGVLWSRKLTKEIFVSLFSHFLTVKNRFLNISSYDRQTFYNMSNYSLS